MKTPVLGKTISLRTDPEETMSKTGATRIFWCKGALSCCGNLFELFFEDHQVCEGDDIVH